MDIAVIGAGAIGSTVAAYLHQAGVCVTLIGRPDQVHAIKNNGLRVQGVRGEETIALSVQAALDREYPLVIFATKTQDLEKAYQQNCNYLESGLVLTTQNGVQADNLLSGHLEKERILSSIVMFGATYTKPGEIVLNFEGQWIIGKPFTPNDMLVQDVAKILQKGFSVMVSDDIMGMKWLKLFINFNNCLPALIGKSMQETFSDMDFCRLSIKLLQEGLEVVQRAGIDLASLPEFSIERIYGLAQMPQDQAAGIMHQTLTNLSKEPVYGSILQSILRSKRSEIDFINGEVVVLAKQIGAKAILNQKIVDLVHRVEETGAFFHSQDIKREFQL